MNKWTKTLACVGLSAVLGMTALTGCGKTIDGTKTVATCKEDKVSLGMANMMLRMNQAQMVSYYSMMGGSTAGIWSSDAGDGKTYGESIKDSTMDQIHDMILLKQHSSDYEVTVSDEEKASIAEAAKKFMESNGEDIISKLAVSQADIEEILTLYTYQNKMYDPMTKDVDTNVEDSEAAQSKITYCRISTAATTDEEGNSVELTAEEKQAKKDQAQAVLEKMNAQEDPAAADMNALAAEVEASLTAVTNTYGSDDTSLDDALKTAANALSDGQVNSGVVEGENAYFVVRMDSKLDAEATQDKKDSIVNERKQTAYDDLLKEWGKKDKLDVKKSLWKKLTLDDYDTYGFKQQEAEDTAGTDTAADGAAGTDEAPAE